MKVVDMKIGKRYCFLPDKLNHFKQQKENTMKNIIEQLLTTKQFKTALESAEKQIYLEAFEYAGRNQSVAAKLLGVSRGTFRTKMKEWDVPFPKDYKDQIASCFTV